MGTQGSSALTKSISSGHGYSCALGSSITVLVIGIITLVGGILAVCACFGKIPANYPKFFKDFSVLGEANSFALLAGGATLSVLSIFALGYIQSKRS